MSVQEQVSAICRAHPDLTWSVCISREGRRLAEVQADRVMRIASLGKLLVLMAAAQRIADEPAFAEHMLARPSTPVADSGLWQHLGPPEISVEDACVLTASVSDNLATNALIGEMGLEACNRIAREHDCNTFVVHDIVRDTRTASDPPCFAESSARDAVTLLTSISGDSQAAVRVRGWLALGTDHSMALRALGADPMSPGAVGEPPHAHKTGSDPGVRADAGVIGSAQGALVYAVFVNCEPDSPSVAAVPDAMRMILSSALDD